jgi:hypothetical protein
VLRNLGRRNRPRPRPDHESHPKPGDWLLALPHRRRPAGPGLEPAWAARQRAQPERCARRPGKKDRSNTATSDLLAKRSGRPVALSPLQRVHVKPAPSGGHRGISYHTPPGSLHDPRRCECGGPRLAESGHEVDRGGFILRNGEAACQQGPSQSTFPCGRLRGNASRVAERALRDPFETSGLPQRATACSRSEPGSHDRSPRRTRHHAGVLNISG